MVALHRGGNGSAIFIQVEISKGHRALPIQHIVACLQRDDARRRLVQIDFIVCAEAGNGNGIGCTDVIGNRNLVGCQRCDVGILRQVAFAPADAFALALGLS